MKKILIALLIVLFIACIYLWVEGQKRVVITSQIEIAATPERVWAVLANIDGWQDWSPIIQKSSGWARKDAVISITMESDEAGDESGGEQRSGPSYQPVMAELDAPLYMRLRAVMMAGVLLTNDKVLEIEATQNGSKLIHREEFVGMLVPVFQGKFEDNIPNMLDSMNQGLKQKVESLKNH